MKSSMKELGSKTAELGFSLIEMMIVIVIVSIVVAAVLAQVNQTQQRATAEQNKLDQFAAARNFVDQIAIDARQMGYPNIRNFDVTFPRATAPNCLNGSGTKAWISTGNYMYDCGLAVGLVKITNNSLRFEGDVDGSGNVYEVSYKINGDGNCASCLERAQVLKMHNQDPLAQAPAANTYTTEIQNVQNTTSIFTAYDDKGQPVTLPVDTTSGATLAGIRTIQISLDVSDPSQRDPQTHQAIEANITSRVQVVNCSMAAQGLFSTTGGIQLTCQ